MPGSIIIYEEALFNEPKILKEQLKRSSKEDIRLAYTMFESSKIPKNFISNLNLYFDAAIVPDSYHIKVYQNCGVKIPIFVLPLGLDISNFLKAPIKRDKNKPFIFANFSSCTKRKNHSVLIQAFAKAFKDNPDVLLKIRSRSGQDGLDITLLSLIDSLKAGNIEFSIRAPNNQEYLKEFIDCDCYVSLSKGEGFSIQPREAMALGIPSIVSSNTAQKTICDSGLVRSVRSNLEEKADIWMYQEDLGYQYNCDIDEVAAALIEMYENYHVYLEKSDLARLWTQQYLYKNLEDHYLCLIGKKKISLGTENLICDKELITNSKTLYKKYQRIKAQRSLAF